MIDSLEKLRSMLLMCRRHGVTQIAFSGISVTFGAESKKGESKAEGGEQSDDVPTDEPTMQQLIEWSIPRGEEIKA